MENTSVPRALKKNSLHYTSAGAQVSNFDTPLEILDKPVYNDNVQRR